jgi:hypothetical protein
MTWAPAFVQGRRGKKLLAAATVVTCVLFGQLARVLNGNIGYANSVNCDSWYFLGLQFNFDILYDSHLFYQSVRFPALLPWSYLTPSFSYGVLNAARFLTYFTLTCVGFMWFSTRLYGIRVAILTTVIFCCSTSFLGVLSHDYLTGAGLAWISLFLGATVEAARSRHIVPWSIASGFLGGLCIYTHLPTILFVWAIPLLFFSLRPQGASRITVRVAIYALGSLAGFASVSIIVGLYNKSLGGRFYFLGEQIQIARSYAEPGILSNFLWRSESIVAIIFTMFAGSGLLLGQVLWDEILRRRRNQERLAKSLVLYPALVCFATSGFLLAYQESGRYIFTANVYGPWIYPALFVGVGAILFQVVALRAMPWRTFAGVVVVILGVFLVAATTTRAPTSDHSLFNAMLASGLAFLVVFFLLGRSRWGVLVLIPLTCLMVFSFPTTYGSSPWYGGQGSQSKDMTLETVKALEIYNGLKTGERPAFWVGGSEPGVVSVPRSFLYCGNFPGSFPSTSVGKVGFEPYLLPLTASALEGHKFLVVVATGSGLGRTAATALRDLGIPSTILGEWPIGSGKLKTSMAVLRIESPKP